MYLQIITPEAILFSGEVSSLLVPGVQGEFQMLENHAPVVSSLKSGYIKMQGNLNIDEKLADKFTVGKEGTQLFINSGTLELNDNKIIILAD